MDPQLRQQRNGKPHTNGKHTNGKQHPRATVPTKQITPMNKTPARAYINFFFPNEKGNARLER